MTQGRKISQEPFIVPSSADDLLFRRGGANGRSSLETASPVILEQAFAQAPVSSLEPGDEMLLFRNGLIGKVLALPNVPVSADRGDVSVTVETLTDSPTQIFNTPLTAARTVTFSTNNAYAGAKFNFVRTAAATGSFNLNIGAGTALKALTAAGQWCEVTYNGSTWILTAAGSL